MHLEDYWGVGPKTAARLEAELGTEAAIDAIEAPDIRRLSEAGLSRGRATQIVRRATSEARMGLLATRDTRTVYNELLDLAASFAITRHAADRIRILTPLGSREAMADRLDDVLGAMRSWDSLDEATRETVLAAVDDFDSIGGGDRAAVEVALALRDAGPTDGIFRGLTELDPEALRDAAAALESLDEGTVRAGADRELDRHRERLSEVERLDGSAIEVLEAIRAEGGVRDADAFREATIQYLTRETNVGVDTIREAAPADAADAADFINTTLRTLVADLREQVDERETAVAADLTETIEAARAEIDAATAAVEHITLYVSLARFGLAFDLTRPTLHDRGTLAVQDARNLSLAAAEGTSVQPVSYGIGDHDLDVPPNGDRAAVLTGANSGGKTTLLETLAQVALLAQMGLPVPADEAEVGVFDEVVFHRRHASFNAGVLESTLRSIVPPVSGGGRTLMLVDEFEAITEPGSAADLLHGLVTLTVERDAVGVFVTHLAEDLRPLPETARIDGIFAEGLDADLELVVDYQPRFGELGRSTPEFIVSRLVANADDRVERTGFETLVEALGGQVRQRTLADIPTTEDGGGAADPGTESE